MRILLCRSGGIGDVAQTLPFVKYLKNKYPDSSIEYLTSKPISELLKDCCPYIDKVWIFDKTKQRQVANKILNFSPLTSHLSVQNNIDYFFNLHNSLTFFLFNLFYIKAKKFFQYKKNYNYHSVLNYAITYNKLISISDLESKILFVNKNNVNELLVLHGLKSEEYVCIVPGVGKARPHRAWAKENWLELVRQISSMRNEIKFAVLGGKEEELLIPFFQSNKNMTNLINKLSLVDNAKIISCSKIVVSCDTGMLHLASALGKKVIGLFGPTEPCRFGPFSNVKEAEIISAKNCQCVGKFKDSKKCKVNKEGETGFCMSTITVENVLSKVKNLIGDEVSTYSWYDTSECAYH